MRKRGKDGGEEATGKCRSSPESSMERKAITSRPSLDSILDRVNRQGSQGKRQGEENPLVVIEWQSIVNEPPLDRHGGYKKKPRNPR